MTPTPTQDTNWAVILVVIAVVALVVKGLISVLHGLLWFIMVAALIGAAVFAVISLLSKKSD